MQYILTEAEYNTLKHGARVANEKEKEKLQALCTLAANHIPVHSPWGCILNENPENRPWYCDDCPAADVCPHTNKRWSK